MATDSPVLLPFLFLVLLALPILGCEGASERSEREPERLLVAVASNFASTLSQLEKQFEAEQPYQLEMAAGSSGKLYAQLLAGAPFDVFLSADQERPELLANQGLGFEPFEYARGRLVLWAPGGVSEVSGSEVSLSNALAYLLAESERQGTRVAVANPSLAPYGRATDQVLNRLHIRGALDQRLVYGENIGQTHLMIATRNAAFGFTSASYLQAETYLQSTNTAWSVPEELHDPIVQQGIWLRRAADNTAAASFLEFLSSDRARQIIRSAGYGVLM